MEHLLLLSMILYLKYQLFAFVRVSRSKRSIVKTFLGIFRVLTFQLIFAVLSYIKKRKHATLTLIAAFIKSKLQITITIF